MKSFPTIHVLASTLAWWLCAATPARAAFLSEQGADMILGRQLPNDRQMMYPTIAIDRTTNKVFAGDAGLHRILRFGSLSALQNGAAAEAVFGQPDFSSSHPGRGPARLNSPSRMWCDDAGRLWVADQGNHRVLRFDNASAKTSGCSADGVLGQVNFQNNASGVSASEMSSPGGVTTDAQGALYVSDSENSRVLRFDNAAGKPNGGPANAVLGQPDFNSNAPQPNSPTGLNNPNGLAVVRGAGEAPNSTALWVADSFHHRVLLFTDANHALNGAAASKVLGKPDLNSGSVPLSSASFNNPLDLATDLNGRLYVTSYNNRIVRFDNALSQPNGSDADAVLGQAGFNTTESGSGPGRLNVPATIALDGAGRLWIGDAYNHRVLRHDAPETKVNGADADGVLGAFSTTADLTRRFDPVAVAIDPASRKLFICDRARHRVIRFASVDALTSGAGAETVFGQPNFLGEQAGTNAARMKGPRGITLDALGNLWVADAENNRVLRFNNAAYRASGVMADGLLGQSSYNASQTGLSNHEMNNPVSVAVGSAGELWVADSQNFRVLRFEGAASKGNGAAADGVLGQPDFSTKTIQLDGSHCFPISLCPDSGGRLWVADYSYKRILRFDGARGKPNGASANGVLGQGDFVSSVSGSAGVDDVTPGGLLIEPNGRLWAADIVNDRLLRWEDAATRPNGTDAAGLLGQPDFGFTESGCEDNHFHFVYGLARDPSGHLWVADHFNQRVMRFSATPPTLSIIQKDAATVTVTYEHLARGIHYTRLSSPDLQSWQAGFLTPTADGSFSIDYPITPGARQFFRLVEP